jgi:hypothetical protein
MRPAEISSHFMLIRMTSQNAKYSAIDKKKSHLNQEIKKLIKKNIFPELYNEQCNKIPSSSKDDNQKITWQNFKTSNSAYSKLCGKLSLFKSVPSRLIEKSAYCSTENIWPLINLMSSFLTAEII